MSTTFKLLKLALASEVEKETSDFHSGVTSQNRLRKKKGEGVLQARMDYVSKESLSFLPGILFPYGGGAGSHNSSIGEKKVGFHLGWQTNCERGGQLGLAGKLPEGPEFFGRSLVQTRL